MVEMNEEYNLNHIYNIDLASEEAAIGDTSQHSYAEYDLFERSLALTSDLKRLPIMRGIDIMIGLNPDIISKMTASSIQGITIKAYVFNCNEDNVASKYRIGAAYGHITYDATNGFAIIHITPDSKQFQGGILLNPQITTDVALVFDEAIADAALAASTIIGNVDIEIDWVKINKKQFEEYILEHIYAKDQE